MIYVFKVISMRGKDLTNMSKRSRIQGKVPGVLIVGRRISVGVLVAGHLIVDADKVRDVGILGEMVCDGVDIVVVFAP